MEKLITKNTSKKTINTILAIFGVGISLYLTYVKLSSDPFICGFGDCGTVQHSKYGSMFGIPVAVLGVVYYFALLTLIQTQKRKLEMYWLIWGVLFSSYLTFIELFVLKAICGWCVVSFINILVITTVHFIPRKKIEEKVDI